MDMIVAEHMSVEFPIYDAAGQSLRHKLLLTPIKRRLSGSSSVGGTFAHNDRGIVVVKALDGINLTIRDGDRLGLIGHNGCGKTTLLRTLAGIYEPTSGNLHTAGRVMPLFNLTEGMTPETTGREWIKLRAVLLGIDRAKMKQVEPDVIEFCQLGDYVDMPVRTYSQGMMLRLAFAITTAISSEILLFDELIGTGDAAFVDKAQNRLERFVERASVMVVATHSADIMRKWCNRAVLLEHGKVMADGDVDAVLKVYEERAAGYAA